MTRVLFIFLDGIGLGADDPGSNPFARAQMPFLERLLGGHRLLLGSSPYEGEDLTLLGIDPNLGVSGLPQSATGQAVLLTGRNIPLELGYHYGPKPNREVAVTLANGGIFGRLLATGKSCALLNAYPPRYFDGIDSGRRLYSSIPLAVTNAGLTLFTQEDLARGDALSADFTGRGWREYLGFPDAPVFGPEEAGAQLGRLASGYDFAFFEYWSTDYAGHKQDMRWAVEQLEMIDGVLEGLLREWDGSQGLILLTSDHGNMEDLSVRRHTANPVPLLLFGSLPLRRRFAASIGDLSHIAPAIWDLVTDQPSY